MTKTRTRKLSELDAAILEMASDQHRSGIMDDAQYRKITVRHLGSEQPATTKPISAKEIRKIRQSANMSQAAFASTLNLSTGYISQLERGTKTPKGPALAILNILRRKGIAAIL